MEVVDGTGDGAGDGVAAEVATGEPIGAYY